MNNTPELDYDALYEIFVKHDWRWAIDGELIVPPADQLKLAVDFYAQKLYDEPLGSTVTIGRLAIQRGPSKTIDVYVLFGEING